MADGPSRQQWAELRLERPRAESALALTAISALPDGREVAIGMDSAGHLHLLIPMDQASKQQPGPDLNGLRVRPRRLETGDFIDLAAPPSHERVFTPFCRDVVMAVCVEDREPWAAVAATIRAWQSAWKPARSLMEKSVQIGLAGELIVLADVMVPVLGAAAVEMWSGPLWERHDFVGESVRLEVKTTRRSRPEHEISRFDQLRAPAGATLLFASIQLEETIGGSLTLATLIDRVIDLVRADSAAVDTLMRNLSELGWSEEMRASGELLRFNLRAADFYAVDEEFPRLPDGFAVPSGVVSVRYTIDLANLPVLGIEDVHSLLRRESCEP
jgi:hypothetical protein